MSDERTILRKPHPQIRWREAYITYNDQQQDEQKRGQEKPKDAPNCQMLPPPPPLAFWLGFVSFD